MKKQKLIIVIKDSLLSSILSDLVTFGFIIFSIWFNYNFTGNSAFVNFIMFMMIFIMLIKVGEKKVKRFNNKIEAIHFLRK